MKLKFYIDINVPAQKAWHELSEGFGDTGKWTSLLDSSILIGAAKSGAHRECRIGKRTLTEHITKMDHNDMQVDYELIDGRPPVVAYAFNSWSVSPLGETRCRVTMLPDIRMKWWAQPMGMLVRFGLSQTMPKVLIEFKHWVETGRVHPRKAKKNSKNNMQNVATAT